VPRGRALGVTVQSPVDDRFNYSEEYLRARQSPAALGRGGAAEQARVRGWSTTGAENDLPAGDHDRARDGDPLGHEARKVGTAEPRHRGWGGTPGAGAEARFSDSTAALIDAEIRRIVDECLAVAHRLLSEHRPQLDALATALLKGRESLDEAQGAAGHRAAAQPAGSRSRTWRPGTRHRPVAARGLGRRRIRAWRPDAAASASPDANTFCTKRRSVSGAPRSSRFSMVDHRSLHTARARASACMTRDGAGRVHDRRTRGERLRPPASSRTSARSAGPCSATAPASASTSAPPGGLRCVTILDGPRRGRAGRRGGEQGGSAPLAIRCASAQVAMASRLPVRPSGRT